MDFSDLTSDLNFVFQGFSDLKFSISDPNFRSEICKFLSRSEIKNFRSENQRMKKIKNFRSRTEIPLGTGAILSGWLVLYLKLFYLKNLMKPLAVRVVIVI